jgi:hypothetical protein
MSAEYEVSSIHIIESVGEKDKGVGLELMARLRRKGGKLAEFPIEHHDVIDRDELAAVLSNIYHKEARFGLAPILHFEAHGAPEGLILRDRGKTGGKTVPWNELADRLRPINIASRFNLLAVFSCCEGIHQIGVLDTENVCPFCAVVGCEGGILTAELLDGYEQFYEILINEGKARKAERALQAAVTKSADTRFRFFTCERAFRTVCKSIKAHNRGPATRAQEIPQLRRELDRQRALHGNLTPSTDAEIEVIRKNAETKTLQDYFRKFYGVAEIPENLNRFNFDAIIADEDGAG